MFMNTKDSQRWCLDLPVSCHGFGRFMKTAAEFTPATGQAWTREMSVKRLTYVHCVTQQLCQVSYQPKANLEAVSTVLVNLLSEIESVESAGEACCYVGLWCGFVVDRAASGCVESHCAVTVGLWCVFVMDRSQLVRPVVCGFVVCVYDGQDCFWMC